MQQSVAIIGGARTPFAKATKELSNFDALDLGVHVVRSVVEKLNLGRDGSKIDEVVLGSVLLNPRLPNIAREVILKGELSTGIVGHSVSANCITGLVAASIIADAIRSGRITVGLAGGMETMSNPTLSLRAGAEKFFLTFNRSPSLLNKVRSLLKYRPRFAIPERPSPKEPSTGLTMGQHCERIAKEFRISRERQDDIACRSHARAYEAFRLGGLSTDIVPLGGVDADRMIRPDTTKFKLASLPPVFDRSPAGTITAGNSSGLTDGASVVCLMSEREAQRQGRDILAYIEAIEFASIAPQEGLLMAPALAVPRLLQRVGLSIDEIDRFEVHEAFAAQVGANLDAWRDGWSAYPEIQPIGEVPPEKLNVWGGSIALGHPFAATGGRLILNAARILKEQDLRTCVISVCAAGGAACAMLVRRR